MERVRTYFASKQWARLQPVAIGCAFFVAGWRALLELLNQVLPHFRSNMVPFWPPYMGDAYYRVSHTMLGLGRWAHWDSYLFVDISAHGYHSVKPGIPEETAFFPSFPVTVGAIARVLHINPILVGLALNFALSIGLAIMVYKLAELMTERYLAHLGKSERALAPGRVAKLSVLFVFACPSSLFFAAFYADALQALAFTAAIYFALRGRYFWSAVGVAAAMATKSLGVALVPAIFMIILSNENVRSLRQWFSWRVVRSTLIVCGGAVVGLGSYMLYLWYRFGDPLLFYKAQALWNRSNSINFLHGLWSIYYAHIMQPQYYGGRFSYGYILMLFVMAIPFLVLGISLWYGIKFRAWWLPVLSFLVLLLPLMSSIMQSLNRYVLSLTPVGVALASFVVVHKVPRVIVGLGVVASVAFLLFLTQGFLQGTYFAG